MQKLSAVILAGGRSSRMGSNKALLELDNTSIIQKQVNELNRYYDEVIVVSNQPEVFRHLGVQVVEDYYPGFGPLAGIHAGLRAASNEGIFVIPCDMPFIPGNLGLQLLKIAGKADGVVLEKGGHLEPLCAVYSKNCLAVIEEFLKLDRRKVIDFFPQVNMLIVPLGQLGPEAAGENAFFNLNTPNDYEYAKSLIN